MKKKSDRKSYAVKICVGGMSGIAAAVVLLLIAAILSDRLPELIHAANWIARLSLLLGAFVCAERIGKRAPEKKALCALAGEGILAVGLLGAAIAVPGDPGLSAILWSGVCIMIGTFAGIAVVSREKKHHHRR